jgi:hypothetical protein
MSALPPKADMFSVEIDVCFVPIADIAQQPMSLSVRAWIYRLDFSITSLTVKLAALARGGNSLKLSIYRATSACAGTIRNTRCICQF